MGKKKRGHPDVEEVLARPWCYYCERDFDDLKILISHQKAKHFKCERCGRRLNTAGGLSVHMNQVHKETLASVENALPNRAGLDFEIFGMEGIPEDVVASHNQRVLQQFYEAEAERRAASGQPALGSNDSTAAAKKPKFESPGDLKKRLAEHKARKAAEAAGESSGNATPMGGGQGRQSPAGTQSPAAFQQPNVSAPYAQNPGPFPGQQGSNPPQFAQPFVQAPYPPAQNTFQAHPPYPGPQAPFGQPQPNAYNPAPPQSYPPPMNQFPPPGQPLPQVGSQQQFQPPYQTVSPGPYGVGPSQVPVGHSPHNLPPNPQSGQFPPPGLPQRPAFGAPQVNALQLQQMHQGHLPNPPALPTGAAVERQPYDGQNGTREQVGVRAGMQDFGSAAVQQSGVESSIDDLISSVVKNAEAAAAAKDAAADVAADKKSKKDKDKSVRLIYSDNEISPEEKMAKLLRFAYTPVV